MHYHVRQFHYTITNMNQETTITFRIESDLKAALEKVCKATDQSISQVLRAAARDYVRKNAQGELLTKDKK